MIRMFGCGASGSHHRAPAAHKSMLRINDYLYRPEELEPWVARIKKVAEDAEETYAVTNNHNLGKATVNALELKAFLSGGPVRVPPVLMEHYPDLQGIAKNEGGDLRTHG